VWASKRRFEREYGYGIASGWFGKQLRDRPLRLDIQQPLAAGEPNETALAGLGRNNGLTVFVASTIPMVFWQWAKSAGGTTDNWGAGSTLMRPATVTWCGRYTGPPPSVGRGESNGAGRALGGNDEIFRREVRSKRQPAWVRAARDKPSMIRAPRLPWTRGQQLRDRQLPWYGAVWRPAQPDPIGSRRLGHIFIVKHDTDETSNG